MWKNGQTHFKNLKYVWPFFNNMHEKVKAFHDISNALQNDVETFGSELSCYTRADVEEEKSIAKFPSSCYHVDKYLFKVSHKETRITYIGTFLLSLLQTLNRHFLTG